MSALSDYAENKLLDHILRNSAFTQPTALYVALYTSATDDTTGGTEVAGGSYTRQTAAFTAAAAGLADNSAAINFAGMPAATVTHVAICDALTAGNRLFHGALASAQVVVAGNTFTFAIGSLDLSLA